MKIANLSLGGECLGHGGSVAANVRFWHKVDMSDSDLLPCKLTTEPHFASRKSLL